MCISFSLTFSFKNEVKDLAVIKVRVWSYIVFEQSPFLINIIIEIRMNYFGHNVADGVQLDIRLTNRKDRRECKDSYTDD